MKPAKCQCGVKLFDVDKVGTTIKNMDMGHFRESPFEFDVYRCPKCFEITISKEGVVVR